MPMPPVDQSNAAMMMKRTPLRTARESIATRACTSRFAACGAFVAHGDAVSDQTVDHHDPVRHGEDPVAHQQAVDGETDRRTELSDEQPCRHAGAGVVAPLLCDLRGDGEDEDDGAGPA